MLSETARSAVASGDSELGGGEVGSRAEEGQGGAAGEGRGGAGGVEHAGAKALQVQLQTKAKCMYEYVYIF